METELMKHLIVRQKYRTQSCNVMTTINTKTNAGQHLFAVYSESLQKLPENEICNKQPRDTGGAAQSGNHPN